MTIGGALDYARLAQLNRPNDPAALAKEVRRLNAQGLTAGDISIALKINLTQVREMIAPSTEEAAQLHAEAWRA